ncbi:MAG: ribonuclease Z [Thermoproteota archaeon]|nr:MAG: ribonuclease Z [Candidatus Korarchaeota archaeon]
MSIRVTILGSGGTYPTPERGLPAIAVRMPGRLYLLDCGGCTQRQIFKSKLKIGPLTHIFITHLHGDHIFGVFGLLQTLTLLDRQKPLYIVGPEGIRSLIEEVGRWTWLKPSYELSVIEVRDERVFEFDTHYVRLFPVNHGVPAFGIVVEEKPRPGRLDVEKADRLGVPVHLRKRLQLGKAVRTPSGRVVHPEEVLGEAKPGRKVVYTGDTSPCDRVVREAKGANLLIHDSMYLVGDEKLAEEGVHSSYRDACEVAELCGVGLLLLTHFSPRYRNKDIEEAEEAAKKYFPRVVACRDFTTVEIDFSGACRVVEAGMR